ncbi:MAG: hypothetical protein Q9225_001046 [Loekoesia sp. 1 TL-2023]
MSTSAADDKPMGYSPALPPADQPLARPPPGQTTNLDHPPSNSYHVYIAAAVCIPFILIFAIVRMYVTIRLREHRSKDDYTFMLATVCTLIYISLVIALLSKGLFGTHVWDLTLGDLRNTPFLLVLLLESLWGPFVWFIKLSLLQLYLYLFGRLQWMKRLAWIAILVTGLFYFSITIAKIALCAPRESETYIMAFSTRRCNNTRVLGVVTGVFNIVSDLYLLVLPVPAVWKLQVSGRDKFRSLAAFMTGIIALNASILGLYYRVRANSAVDDTWKIMPLYLAILIEMTCGIIVLCMPSVAKIMKEHNITVFGYFNRVNSDANQQGTSVRMVKLPEFSSLRNKLSHLKSKHGHKTSYNSDTQLGTNRSDSATLNDITALPKV